MQVLPNIDRTTVSKLDQLFNEFIWNGRRPKIKLSQLKAAKTLGGAGLINITAKDRAMKISWIQILRNDEKCADLAFRLINFNLKENIFRCNLNPKDIEDVNPASNFWRDMLAAWCSINYRKATSPDGQIIWYNSDIKIQGRTIFYQKAVKAGLLWVSQLYKNGQLLSLRQIDGFHITLMEYQGIISALPSSWKRALRSEQVFLNVTVYDEYVKETNLSRKIYNKLIEEDYISVIKKKWESLRCLDSTDDEVRTACRKIYAVTNLPKLRSFQYRIINKALVLNSHLFRWKLRENNLCTFCDEDKEDFEHLFLNCPHVTEIWAWFAVYVKKEFNDSNVNISVKSLLANNASNKWITNFLFLATKQYIYKCRCGKRIPNHPELQAQFKSYCNIEFYIAKSNGKINKHNLKWCKNNKTSDPGNVEIVRNLENYIDEYLSNV